MEPEVSGTAEPEICGETRRLSEYIAGVLTQRLPEAVLAKAKQHVLDSLAAIVSGSRLRAGQLASRYVAGLGGAPQATLIGTGLVVPAAHAALANGMAGHADETDDSHIEGRFHPGCAIIPAAQAIAEWQGRSGQDYVRAVALGYDIGARMTRALGFARPDTSRHSTHSLASLFGAAACAAALLRLNPTQVRHNHSYAAQQASGIPFWNRDREHVEKAFDFGGMGARNGVTSATMVAAGFSAVDDPFSGKHNLFTAFGETADPSELVSGLGERFEILGAAIKKWSVGSPIQAVLDATQTLTRTHALRPDDIQRIVITMPDDRIHIVNDRTMPDVCVQHLAALLVLDGTVTFASAHDLSRMADPEILRVRKRIDLVPSSELTQAKPSRQAIVEIETTDDRRLHHHAKAVRGTPDNPMAQEEVEAKALELMAPVTGRERAQRVVETVRGLEQVSCMTELRPLLMA
jgi:2-methylcitrate dehydratase PrpD